MDLKMHHRDAILRGRKMWAQKIRTRGSHGRHYKFTNSFILYIFCTTFQTKCVQQTFFFSIFIIDAFLFDTFLTYALHELACSQFHLNYALEKYISTLKCYFFGLFLWYTSQTLFWNSIWYVNKIYIVWLYWARVS